MQLFKLGSETTKSVQVTKKTDATDCTLTLNAPCFYNFYDGRSLNPNGINPCPPNHVLLKGFNVTINSEMKNEDLIYTITATHSGDFTTLIAIFTPFKCSAVEFTTLMGIAISVAQMLLN